MNKSVLCLFILIIGLALGMGAACASENLDTPASVDESPMEVENGEALSSNEGNALEKSQTTENNNLKESQTTESEEGFNGSSNPLDSKLSAPQNDPALTANEGTFDDLQRLIEANYGGTLVLDSNYRYNSNYDFKSIPITQSITIDGNNSVLNGNAETMIFTITGDNVVLKNIIFTEGYGGAIRWNGKGGTLINCTFDYNLGYDGANGGSVYWNGDDGTMMDCIFTNNIAEGNGGAVYWDADGGSMIDCSFIDNIAEGNGGAVFWNGTEANLINCNFNNNRAKYGGAVYSFRSFDGIVANCNFTDNYASTDGGAFYFSRSFNGIVTNCNFTANNASTSGGAIWIYSGSVENCIFTNNSASNYGGAVIFFLQGGVINCNFTNNTGNMGGAVLASECDLLNCNFAYNNASSLGGAVYLSGYKNSNIIDCNFTKNSAFSGGAIFIRENGNITNCNFVDNNASSQGGAISIFAQVIVTNCNFTGNNASTKGGALYLYERATVEKCSFTNNIALIDGGAIYSSSRSIVTDCNFIGNNASSNGGAVYFIVRGAIANCNFTDSTSSYGGAIYFYYGDADVTDCNFAGNTAKEGGALFFMHDGGDVTGCNFTGNNASDNGGAILFNCSNGVVTGCNFAGNNALISAGAIYFASTGSVSNSNFTDNSASNDGGAVNFYGIDSNGRVLNCEFVNNSASNNAGALHMYSGSVLNCNFTDNSADAGGAVFIGFGNVTNCNFINNIAEQYGGAISAQSGTVAYCNFVNNSAGRNGGAIDSAIGLLSVLNCNFTDNSATWSGGAIYIQLGSDNNRLSGSNFINNSAIEYGGAVSWNGANGTLIDSNFINNTARHRGGAVSWGGRYGNLSDSTFINNSVSYSSRGANGGAVYWSGDNGSLSGSNFINNSAQHFAGAVLWRANNGVLSDSNFIENNAGNGGGAVFWDGDTLMGYGADGILSGCNFIGNSASGHGGAVYWWGDDGTLSGSSFINNHADVDGGAVYWFEDDGFLTCSSFINNSATNAGGALFLAYRSDRCVLSDCNFTDNIAVYGGAVHWTGPDGNLTGSSFINNSANEYGGAVIWGGHNGILSDSTFSGNNASLYGGGIYWSGRDGVLSGSNFTDNSAKIGNGVYVRLIQLSLVKNKINTENADVVLYGQSAIVSYLNATVLGNTTVYVSDFNVVINATVSDDMGNLINAPSFKFLINGEEIDAVYNDVLCVYEAEYTLPNISVYPVGMTYISPENLDVYIGILNGPKANVTEFSVVVGGQSGIIPYGENAPVYVTLLGINGVGLNETLTVVVNNKPYTVAVKNGKGSFNVSGLAPGQYAAWSMFSGNDQYNSAYATWLFSVLAPETRLIVNVDDIVVGEELYVKINLTDADGNPIMGMVNLSGDLFETSVAVNGYLEIPVSDVLAGNYTIAVSFAGDDTYESADNATTFEVKQVSDYVFLATAGTGFDFGQTVYVSVTLPDDATGTVNITINGRTYDAVVENGEATIEIPDLAAGDYPEWEVFYSGDNKYVPGVTNTDIYVFPADAELQVYFDKDTIIYGEYAVLFIGINADATGTIAVYNIDDDENPVLITNITVQEALEEGVTIDDLNAGLHFFEIRYSGDMNFTEDTRRDFLSVEKAFINWTVEDVPEEIDVGDNITIVLDWFDPADAPGKLNITVDGKQIGVYTFDEARDGILLNIFNKSGKYNIAVAAVDDSNFDYAGSVEMIINVNALEPEMKVNITENPKVGDVIKATVTLPGDATGTVDVYVGDKLIEEGVELVKGTATIDLGDLAAGNHTVVMSYIGDEVYSEVMGITTFEVVKADLELEIDVDASELVAGDSVEVTIYASEKDANNYVIVDVNGKSYSGKFDDGMFSFTIEDLDATSYEIVAIYVGDEKYGEVNRSTSFTIGKAGSYVEAVVPAFIVEGEDAFITVIVGPSEATGNVTVYVDGEKYDTYDMGDKIIITGLANGTHTIGVQYNGDDNYNASELMQYPIAVKYVITEGDVHRLGSISYYGYNSSVILYFEPEFENATGNITLAYYDIHQGYIYYNGTVENGFGIIWLPVMDVGDYELPFIYSGDDNFTGLTTTVSFVVLPLTTEMTITPSENIKVGDVANVTVTVVPGALNSDVTFYRDENGQDVKYEIADALSEPAVVVPGITGTVDVYVDGNLVAKGVELVEGTVTVPVEGLATGNHAVTVYYSGDEIYDVCTGDAVLKVDKVVSTITVEAKDIKEGEIAVITVTVPDGATGIVLVDLGVAKSYGEIKDGKAIIYVSGLPDGNYTVNAIYQGDSKYGETDGSDSIEVIKEPEYFIKVTMIDGLKLTAVLTDDNGNPVANALVSYNLDDGEAVNVTTNDKGEFVCDVESDSVLTMSYAKDDEVLCSASITLKNINPNRQSTWIDVPANMEMVASDFKKGEAGQIFAFYLRDANGNGLANKVIKIGIFDKKYTVKTDATGRAELPIRIENANYYTYAPAFLGDKDYEASLGVCSLKIVKKSTTITPAKTSYSFASSAKTKTVTATLKSTNSFIPNGKQATLTIAGKTFKTTIGDKGQINFNIGSITLKGTYKVQIKFAGTNTYAASNSQTITIKIA